MTPEAKAQWLEGTTARKRGVRALKLTATITVERLDCRHGLANALDLDCGCEPRSVEVEVFGEVLVDERRNEWVPSVTQAVRLGEATEELLSRGELSKALDALCDEANKQERWS